MKLPLKYYSLLGLVLLVSILAALIIPTTDFLKGIITLPAVGALAAALFQILRDQASHEKQLQLQKKEQFFNLSVTSHMANVTFDKHAVFCEKYLNKINNVIKELFKQGPSKEALNLTKDLYKIREESVAWLTSDILETLITFERGVDRIGLKAMELEDLPVGEKRSAVVKEMHDVFSDVAGLERLGGDKNDYKVAASQIILYLRDILGIEELTTLRKVVLKEALVSLHE